VNSDSDDVHQHTIKLIQLGKQLMQYFPFYRGIIGLLLCSWLMVGCATTPNNSADPWENFNRGVFAFNEGLDKAVLKPVAESYKAITPQPIDKGISNFFSNLNDVVVIGNDLLQLKFKQAAADTGRFLLNSTVGLLGLVDVASELGLPKNYEDFGQTLGYWGVENGPYLVLPFLGPSSLRDTAGRGVDIFLDPRFYYANYQGTDTQTLMLSTYGVEGVDFRADLLGTERILETAALDKYSYIRDAYLARREYLVYDGNLPQKPQSQGGEDIFDEEDLFEDVFDEEDLFEEEEETQEEGEAQEKQEVGEEAEMEMIP
jgi:phospholipid-binding lipoprotein MlaA